MRNFNQVQRALTELTAEGIVRNVAPDDPLGEQKLEQMKGAITFRAAYYINQIDSNMGLLSKPDGNNVKGYKADVIMHRDGTTYDISTNSQIAVIIQDAGGVAEPDLIPRWRQPTKELAGLTIPTIPDVPGDGDNIGSIIDALALVLMNQGKIMDQNDQILASIQSVRNDVVNFKFPEFEASNRLLGSIIFKPKK